MKDSTQNIAPASDTTRSIAFFPRLETPAEPRTEEEFLEREEALALEGALQSASRLGHDVLGVFDVPAYVRRHPLAASLASTLAGVAAGIAVADPRARKALRGRVSTHARRNGHERVPVASRGESRTRSPSPQSGRKERGETSALGEVLGPIGQAFKAWAVAVVLERLTGARDRRRFRFF